MMLEVELKGVVDDPDAACRRIEAAGARLTFRGRLEDRRYDTRDGQLAGRDEVLRVRVYSDDTGRRASIDWKGPARREAAYKLRDEITSTVGEPDALAGILQHLGFQVTGEIDRDVTQYSLGDATVRFERYPRMDTLVEVEGPPPAIESAIAALGIPRPAFTAERLVAFVERFERRTGQRAALNRRELPTRPAEAAHG